ncbi:uncharacterized protein [Musca autumnalis]|uniref:uncharacterized protein n=1 Tax=Musca autumnalis TaxID=221902 RepID=UPI003CEA24D2
MWKFYCFIVIMVAISQAPQVAAHKFGDVLESEEREQIMSMLDETKEMATQVDELLLKVLPQIPSTSEYEELHKYLQEYYDLVHAYKERKYNCRKRAALFLQGFKEFSEEFSNEKAAVSHEKEEVVKLLNKAGLKEMREQFNDKMSRDEFDYVMEAI